MLKKWTGITHDWRWNVIGLLANSQTNNERAVLALGALLTIAAPMSGSRDWSRKSHINVQDIEDIGNGKKKHLPDINTLRCRVLQPDGLEFLSDAMKPCGRQNEGAQQIREALIKMEEDKDLPVVRNMGKATHDEVYKYLTSYKGVGPKIALVIMLYCLKRTIFGADVNVARILGNLGAFKSIGITYEEVNATPDKATKASPQKKSKSKKTKSKTNTGAAQCLGKINDYLYGAFTKKGIANPKWEVLIEVHALLIQFASTLCTKRNPKCEACGFGPNGENYCDYAKQRPAGSSSGATLGGSSGATSSGKRKKGAGMKPKTGEVIMFRQNAQTPAKTQRSTVLEAYKVTKMPGAGHSNTFFIPKSPTLTKHARGRTLIAGNLYSTAYTLFGASFPMRGTYQQPNEILQLKKRALIDLDMVPELKKQMSATDRANRRKSKAPTPGKTGEWATRKSETPQSKKCHIVFGDSPRGIAGKCDAEQLGMYFNNSNVRICLRTFTPPYTLERLPNDQCSWRK